MTPLRSAAAVAHFSALQTHACCSYSQHIGLHRTWHGMAALGARTPNKLLSTWLESNRWTPEHERASMCPSSPRSCTIYIYSDPQPSVIWHRQDHHCRVPDHHHCSTAATFQGYFITSITVMPDVEQAAETARFWVSFGQAAGLGETCAAAADAA
jgi:hypothetical protein